ncbi:uncharacterized protein JCM6883_003624 [Sporobolomyces salmoneus]|uniref:uncharacterized protein n=1 Tax=Sporobolomyces salmoneus TaxID=183962 RepID=UPI00317B24D0
MSLKALWKPVALQAGKEQLARSSHGLVSIGSQEVLVFGGELKPRTPVDGDLLQIGSVDSSSPSLSTLSSSSDSSQPWPSSRVGASLVSDSQTGKVYLWGGRGGKEMGTFTSETGIWESELPFAQNNLYLHAGCPASGRLGQLHSLDLSTLTWTQLPDAPGPGRGGTVLTPLPRICGSLLARFGGFAGYELDGLDVYDIEKRGWRTVETEGEAKPDKRSVHVFVGLDGELKWEGKNVVGVLALGEREAAPAELGHNGSGYFHNDAWGLLATKEEGGDVRLSWTKLASSTKSEGIPEARGWLPAAHLSGSKIVFQGGLNEQNERLADAWTLEVVKE